MGVPETLEAGGEAPEARQQQCDAAACAHHQEASHGDGGVDDAERQQRTDRLAAEIAEERREPLHGRQRQDAAAQSGEECADSVCAGLLHAEVRGHDGKFLFHRFRYFD